MNNDLISRSELKKAIEELAITEELVDYDCDDVSTTGVSQYLDRPDVLALINNAPTVEPKTDILEQIIAEINTSNRGTCDYYIVDRIEEIINEYQKSGAE